MATRRIYLLNPYKDVIKVTALGDSVFRLKINNSIFYTIDEVFERIDSVPKFHSDEDEVTRIAKWIGSYMSNTQVFRYAIINYQNFLQTLNSFSGLICGEMATQCVHYFRYVLPDETCDNVCDGGHQWNCTDSSAFDQINKMPFYKSKYQTASFEELKADKYLYTEPLKVFNLALHYSSTNYTSYITNSSRLDMSSICPTELPSIFDNVYMKLPSGSYIVLPVRSPNVPKSEVNTNLRVYANALFSAASGITGEVEMPFNLLQVTGSGSVVVDGVTYNLPDDEAALKAACQTTQYTEAKWIHGFTILTNTGGIEAEFLVNTHVVKLFHENVIDYTIYSGNLSIERHKTNYPIPTYVASVDKKTNDSFTFDFNTYFTTNKSVRLPVQCTTWDSKLVYFLPNSAGKYSQPIPFNFTDIDMVYKITAELSAAEPTYDQCFAAKLYPRVETFSDSLELSFTIVDDSDVYYTTDGSTPTAESTKYTSPFMINQTTTVKWMNIKEGYANSHVNSRVITKV